MGKKKQQQLGGGKLARVEDEHMTEKALTTGPPLKSGARHKATKRKFAERVESDLKETLLLDNELSDDGGGGDAAFSEDVASLWRGVAAAGEELEVEALKLARKALGVVVKGAPCAAPVADASSWAAARWPCAPMWAECGRSLSRRREAPTMTPVQRQVWPAALGGRDVLAIAPTGSGKTLAYLLPAAARFYEEGRRTLVLAPTRELARQVHGVGSRVPKWSKRPLDLALVVGGAGEVSRAAQAELLKVAHLTVATPGRLLDLARASGGCRRVLKQTSVLVIDEADRMLHMGFEDQLHELAGLIPAQRQTLLFTATFPLRLREAAAKWWRGEDCVVTIRVNTLRVDGDRAAVAEAATGSSSFPGDDGGKKQEEAAADDGDDRQGAPCSPPRGEGGDEAEAKEDEEPSKKKRHHGPSSLAQVSSDIVQTVHVCATHKRQRLLLRFLDKIVKADAETKRRNSSRILIFCNTAVACKEVHELAIRHDHKRVAALHGKLPQQERDAALWGFRAGKTTILVATDVASRGLDVPRLPYVINWDFPTSLESYTHRVGRVGRGEKDPNSTEPPTALSFFTRNLAPLALSLCALLVATKQKVDPQLQSLADERRAKAERKPTTDAPAGASDDIDDLLLSVLRSVANDVGSTPPP